ncbi:MAG: glycosyltransferase family 1 protein [Chloroflexia bacterium]|nr:glycosyltransferase family 1 protein [Chloroflexia bacterium]
MDSSAPRSSQPLAILFAMFQGGGNVPLLLPIVRGLVTRGHRVRVLAGPGVRASRAPISPRFLERIAATGASLVPFEEPDPHPFQDAPPLRGLVRGWAPKSLDPITANTRPNLWAPAWAMNVTAELRRAPADVVAADYVLLGALAAAEAADTPAAALVHKGYFPWPTPGAPPFGTGLPPARGPLGRLRETLYHAGSRRISIRDGLPAHNRARAHLGLPPLRSPLEQYDRAARVLLLASRVFDFPIRRLPPNVRYVGTPFDDEPVADWISPWPAGDPRPLVLVSLSTLPQGQGPVMHQILTALASLPVRALVTLGPALEPAQFTAPTNARIEPFVPHSAVLPEVAAMVTQGGLSTVMKALAHGVPLVCIPLLADQPDNAARVVAHGAGVRVGRDPSPEQIGQAIMRVVTEAHFREGARRLARVLTTEDGAQLAAEEIETAARDR